MSPARPLARPESQIIGFIDLGTNSVRLMVVRLGPDHSWSTITVQKEPVRLGEGEFGAERALQPAAMDRAALVCRSFADLARSHGAETVVAVATSATREAGNQAAFVRRLREDAGIDVHVVSGQEEARLIFLGVLSAITALSAGGDALFGLGGIHMLTAPMIVIITLVRLPQTLRMAGLAREMQDLRRTKDAG